MLIHVVRPGETVYAIARNYGVDPRRLLADNGVPADGALAVGQTLVLRFPNVVHAVRPGETLSAIARSYGVSVRSLWRNNPELLGGSLLAPGQVLVITYHEERLGTAVANGYAYPFLSPALLAETAPFLSYLTPFTYGISRELGLLPLRDGELLAGARAHGTGAVMHLSTYTEEEQFDAARAERLLTDAAAQARLLGEIQRTMAEKGFSGLDVDFEYLPGALAEAYAAFLSRLWQALRAQGHFLWAALAPKTRPDQPGTLYEGHDYARVGAATDAVLLMTYEWELLAHTLKPLQIKDFWNNICTHFLSLSSFPLDKQYDGVEKARFSNRAFSFSKFKGGCRYAGSHLVRLLLRR